MCVCVCLCVCVITVYEEWTCVMHAFRWWSRKGSGMARDRITRMLNLPRSTSIYFADYRPVVPYAIDVVERLDSALFF